MTQVELSIEGEGLRLAGRVTVPEGATRAGELLPVVRALADGVVAETCRAVEAAGERISCTKGCGACCRNLVAISEVEARRLREVVDALPPARRAAVLARFRDARARLEAASLLGALQATERLTDEEYGRLVGDYFRQGIACPFLEDESCSIYEERPIACREFLVTSPPEFCARAGSEGVRRVELPVRVFNAIARWQGPSDHVEERWVPLILATEWAAEHAEEPPPRPGPELLKDLLSRLRS